MTTQYSMLIGGRLVQAGATLDVLNPATEEVIAKAPDAGSKELEMAVTAARKAFKGWSATPIAERQALLKQAGDVLSANVQELAALLTSEQGKPLAAAVAEVQAGIGWFYFHSQASLPVLVSEDSDTRRVETHHVPLGVVCAISPWNFPVMLSVWKLTPALVTGNTLVLKPSPFTPLTVLKIGELLKDVFPAGVLNIITGGDGLGPLMTSHAGFDKISFTGSTATGRRVMESAAKSLKRVTLELGGNDAAIVLPDVDVAAVAERIFMGAFYNTAQVCTATKRLYIHESIYDQLRDHLAGIAKALKVGDGSEADTILGPIQNRLQYQRVNKLIEDAKANHLTLIEGREVPKGRGYFIPVTLVDNPPDDARVVTEEAFGPVLPLLKYKTIDEAIERANASEYGLAGAVWGSNVAEALAVAARMETGTVWINENLYLPPMAPFAGHKQSGVGVENGQDGLQEYTNAKTYYIPKK
ncbi:MAG: aldehyde dehydrogenase [Hydrocarboniphaga sp.]|uniref:aldehyde dehydrogenase family protein n=1 Tax=Hydrocarboniphaga sp. TaxID=2033016 RepID=UPI00260D6B3C|nr:aldehyde dehydrogenase family protein [Hydrocarboniphaga sp.]MDB5969173.1 aldehyde dehydrogenase [Hydrocarboniphaga sp.]